MPDHSKKSDHHQLGASENVCVTTLDGRVVKFFKVFFLSCIDKLLLFAAASIIDPTMLKTSFQSIQERNSHSALKGTSENDMLLIH